MKAAESLRKVPMWHSTLSIHKSTGKLSKWGNSESTNQSSHLPYDSYDLFSFVDSSHAAFPIINSWHQFKVMSHQYKFPSFSSQAYLSKVSSCWILSAWKVQRSEILMKNIPPQWIRSPQGLVVVDWWFLFPWQTMQTSKEKQTEDDSKLKSSNPNIDPPKKRPL